MTPIPEGAKGGIEYPDFKKIVERCKEKIALNFPDYRNSWKDNKSLNMKWWVERLQNEVTEVDNLKFDGTSRGYINELVDVINICSFMIDNILNKRMREPIEGDEIYMRTWRYG